MYHSGIVLLSNAVDYAGTFPPAQLPLHEALAQGASFRNSANHPWLLGRQVVGLSDLRQIHSKVLYDCGANGAPWNFTVLGTPVTDDLIDRCETIWVDDARYLAQWNQTGSSASCPRQVVGYETRLPVSFLDDAKKRRHALDVLVSLFAPQIPPVILYLEIPKAKGWETTLHEASELFSKAPAAQWRGLGIKFRTGGEATPTSRELATVLSTCAAHSLRFKATQGLHHPLTGKNGLGFVNLFTALTFSVAVGRDFSINQIVECLDDSSVSNFSFGAEHFAWRDFSITLAQLEEARAIHGACFGSCSLAEPDDFLKKEFSFE